ncbi:hypothetical protein SFRURICE_016351 [Spodoptera frugiperda]|nr:hypothetical protein SFRURICE_016351 [Spodoptera frugiperda]
MMYNTHQQLECPWYVIAACRRLSISCYLKIYLTYNIETYNRYNSEDVVYEEMESAVLVLNLSWKTVLACWTPVIHTVAVSAVEPRTTRKRPLHRFPKWEYPHTERFNQWKSVLSIANQERGNNYIYNSVRICHRHFEDYYKSPSKLLTRNAIPTLNLDLSQNLQITMPLPQSPQITVPLAEQFVVGEEPASASVSSRVLRML